MKKEGRKSIGSVRDLLVNNNASKRKSLIVKEEEGKVVIKERRKSVDNRTKIDQKELLTGTQVNSKAEQSLPEEQPSPDDKTKCDNQQQKQTQQESKKAEKPPQEAKDNILKRAAKKASRRRKKSAGWREREKCRTGSCVGVAQISEHCIINNSSSCTLPSLLLLPLNSSSSPFLSILQFLLLSSPNCNNKRRTED